MLDQIRQMVRQEVTRVMAAAKHPRDAVITSVDPDTYSAKVRFEPHDPDDPDNGTSGWIPIQAIATGAGFGMYSVPNVGDPVEVAFKDGDHMSPRIVQRHASEQNQPPEGMKAGEHWMVHGTGAVLALKADGTVFMGGAGTVKNRGGKDPATGKDSTPKGQQPQAKQSVTMAPDGSLTLAHKSGGTITMSPEGKITIKPQGQDAVIDASNIIQQAAKKMIGQAGKILMNCG